MAKNEKEGKARVRVFFGEIEGDNETIRDGLRSIAAAVNKTFQQENTVIKVIAAGTDGDPKALSDAVDETFPEGEVVDGSDERDFDLPAKSNARGKTRPRKPPTYTFVKDLNLRPEGKQSLRDFYAAKKPSDQQQIITVVLYYLHRILEIDKISINHIYTSLKDIEVRIPPDISQVVRTISSRKGHIDSSDSDDLKMTTPGDNFIEHDLSSTERIDNGK